MTHVHWLHLTAIPHFAHYYREEKFPQIIASVACKLLFPVGQHLPSKSPEQVSLSLQLKEMVLLKRCKPRSAAGAHNMKQWGIHMTRQISVAKQRVRMPDCSTVMASLLFLHLHLALKKIWHWISSGSCLFNKHHQQAKGILHSNNALARKYSYRQMKCNHKNIDQNTQHWKILSVEVQ